MPYECIEYKKLGGGIAVVALNRPEKLNALSVQLQLDYVAALKEAEADSEVNVIIVKGNGRAFSAGYDIAPRPPAPGQTHARRSPKDDASNLKVVVSRWMTAWHLKKPVICQIHGYCLAGGTDLAFCTDITIAAEDARIGHPGIRALGMPLTSMYPMNMGTQRAKMMLLTGDPISGKQAEEWGLVAKSVPADKLEEEVMGLANRLAAVPTELVELNKLQINKAWLLMGLEQAQDSSCELDAIAHTTDVVLEFARISREQGLKAALEWRDKPFSDYRGSR